MPKVVAKKEGTSDEAREDPHRLNGRKFFPNFEKAKIQKDFSDPNSPYFRKYLRGIPVLDDEYWFWRNCGYDHTSSYRRAIDYWRKHLRRELTFFEDDSPAYCRFDGGIPSVDLRDFVMVMMTKLTSSQDRRLWLTLLRLSGVDKKVDRESLFEEFPDLLEMNLTEIKWTKKKAAELAGFSTRDKALKAYHGSLWSIRTAVVELGVSSPLDWNARPASMMSKSMSSCDESGHAE